MNYIKVPFSVRNGYGVLLLESRFPRSLEQTTQVAFDTTPSDDANEQISSQMSDVMRDNVDCVNTTRCNAIVTVVDAGTSVSCDVIHVNLFTARIAFQFDV